MRIVRGADEWTSPLSGAVVSIGNFDGVHHGHQEILRRGRELAHRRGASLAVVTFEPHPLRIVALHRAPAILTPLEEKLRCLADAGVDATLVLASEPTLLSLEPDEFIQQIILPRFRPSHIVEGQSFGFGRGRSGNVETLAALGPRFGFETVVVPPVQFEQKGLRERISSSLLRRLLSAGRIVPANQCTGRRYALIGTVIHGRGRGRELGFPTANIRVGDQLIPGEGVYAAVAHVLADGSQPHPAAVSIGHTPTFEDAGLQVEAHLLDFEGTLTDASVRLELVDWVRAQQRFEGPGRLAEQIERDVRQVRQRLAGLDSGTGAVVESGSA